MTLLQETAHRDTERPSSAGPEHDPAASREITDAELAGLVASGNRMALESVFLSHGGAVKSTAVRVLRDEALAEDVVQEVFVRFWKAADRFDPSRGTLRTYLAMLGHRRAVDIVRSESARHRREERTPHGMAPNVEDEALSHSLGESVREALLELSTVERVAIELAYFGGLTYVEAARKLGAPEGTVKSRIRIGMRKLSVSLEGMST